MINFYICYVDVYIRDKLQKPIEEEVDVKATRKVDVERQTRPQCWARGHSGAKVGLGQARSRRA